MSISMILTIILPILKTNPVPEFIFYDIYRTIYSLNYLSSIFYRIYTLLNFYIKRKFVSNKSYTGVYRSV